MILCKHCNTEVKDNYYNKLMCRCKSCLKVYNHEQYIKHKDSILAKEKIQRKTPEGKAIQAAARNRYQHTERGKLACVYLSENIGIKGIMSSMSTLKILMKLDK